jgi:cytochrome bd ubiquinol oxidase subunit II
MTLAEAVAAVMFVSLVLYTVLAGADFGGGVWDLFARGPRAVEQRSLIEHAIAPVWEANHVWLILIVVLLFTGFPRAYSTASIALHVPLTLMLVGVVLRGSAFAFRKYESRGERLKQRWGRLFAGASIVSPVALGVVLGAISSGRVRVTAGIPEGGFFAPWLEPFPFLVGLLTLALSAYLAAVYLTVEAATPELAGDFRVRGLWSGAVTLGLAVVTGVTMPMPQLRFWPRLVIAVLAWAAGFWCLAKRRYVEARFLAVVQATLLVAGWAVAQYPHLIRPDVTIENAAAPEATLRLLLWALALGALLLIPSLGYLFRVFKRARAFTDLDE